MVAGISRLIDFEQQGNSEGGSWTSEVTGRTISSALITSSSSLSVRSTTSVQWLLGLNIVRLVDGISVFTERKLTGNEMDDRRIVMIVFEENWQE